MQNQSNLRKSIQIVLPGSSRTPGGGPKVVYEYANYLSQKGYLVTIYFFSRDSLKRFRFPEAIRRFVVRILVAYWPRWFLLEAAIQKKCIFEISNDTIEDGDAIFATAVGTAADVAQLSNLKGKKFYLIQDHENWNVSDDYVHATYQMGMRNIVVSKWLFDIVKKYSKTGPMLVSNSINTELFDIKTAIEKRNASTLIFHWRSAPHKGGAYAFQIIQALHEKHPDFRFTAVSSEAKPKGFPDYIKYIFNATPAEVAKLNNENAIFLCTSIAEGFGLPGLEAMACGCALVTFGYYGVFDYAIDKENALISDVKDVEATVENIEKLILDDKLRHNLAKVGYQMTRKRSLQCSGKRLEELILLECERSNR